MGKRLADLTAGGLVLRILGWAIWLMLGTIALVYLVVALVG